MKKNSNRSTLPESTPFTEYMLSGWGMLEKPKVQTDEVSKYTQQRRRAVCDLFPGRHIVIEAGDVKVRANDTFYRYRPDSSFTWLSGWGARTTPGAILVINPEAKAVLFFRSPAGEESDEFFTDSHNGKFWVGPKPDLKDIEALLGIECRDIKDFELPSNALLISDKADIQHDKNNSEELNRFKTQISQMRLIKDSWEIAQIQKAIDATAEGFNCVMQSINRAKAVCNGERVIEGAFYTAARCLGHDTGYDTIAAAGANACVLHWTQNDGPVKDGELLLVDAGIECETLYTADITRTVPISGKFTEVQSKIYSAVLEAADAAIAAAVPGKPFHVIHDAAMHVIQNRIAEWGFCDRSDNALYRRYMVHGTGHHLGLDVHDCSHAPREKYHNGILTEGMVFTVEPGLYFHKNDLTVPEEFRGIGVRIEDNILITSQGSVNMSRNIPRSLHEVERWVRQFS